MINPKAPESECARERDQVRIVEIGTYGPTEFRHLFPPDAPESAIAEDQVHGGGLLPLRGLQLMDAHQESTVSAQGHNPAFRIRELRGDSSRERDAHRGRSEEHTSELQSPMYLV